MVEDFEMRTNDEIINIILELKEDQDLSLEELATSLNLTKSTLSRYLNQTKQFPFNRVGDFAKVLGVKPEYLLGFEH